MLDEILARLQKLSPEQFKDLEKEINEAVPDQVWYPNPGPQTEAYLSKADILLYGGEPGGGKTGLGLGLALTQHHRSLVVRKQFTDLEGVVDNLAGILKDTKGLVRGNRPKYKMPNGGLISFQGTSDVELDSGKQGNPFDLIFVDEAAQQKENIVRMMIGWNRLGSGVPTTQRCRVVFGSNPPVDSTGVWLGEFFGPWLDPKHPNPAKFGELRWFIFDKKGNSLEVDSKNKIIIDGEEYSPHSRTYIPAKLEDNPYINAEDYRKNLQTIPEPFRSMLLSGNFLAAREDQKNQVIPTSWVQAAMARWEKRNNIPPQGIPMCNIGLDCSGGGRDQAIISPRYDHYFAQLIKFETVVNEYGSQMAAEIIKARRDRAQVTIDMGGGYGSGVWAMLKDNIGSQFMTAYRGASEPTKRTKDGSLSYFNLRSQCYWEFREALNPDQDGGSQVELPMDSRLLAGLTAPIFYNPLDNKNKIKIETKEDVTKKLGYSPDEADAVVMSWHGGKKGLIPETMPRMNFSNKELPTKMNDKYAHRRGI